MQSFGAVPRQESENLASTVSDTCAEGGRAQGSQYDEVMERICGSAPALSFWKTTPRARVVQAVWKFPRRAASPRTAGLRSQRNPGTRLARNCNAARDNDDGMEQAMDSSLVVGDKVATKSGKRWVRSLGRMLLPGGLFVLAFLRALSLSDGAVASDRMALSQAHASTTRSGNLTSAGER